MNPESSRPTSLVTFSLASSPAQRSWSDFTVEIRRTDSSFVGRVPASQGIRLEQGLYFVTARLPSGIEASCELAVGVPTSILPKDAGGTSATPSRGVADYVIPLGQAATIPLDNPTDSRNVARATTWREDLLSLRNLSKNLLSDLVPQQRELSGGLERLGPQPGENQVSSIRFHGDRSFSGEPSRVVWYQGNPLKPETLAVRSDLPARLEFDTPLRIEPPVSGTLIAQYRRPQQLTLNMVVPAFAPSGCSMVAHYIEEEQPRLDVVLDNTDADLLMRYLQGGYATDAVTFFNAQAAQRLLSEKAEDPIGAVIGAYVLLRFTDRVGNRSQEADHWERWIENLRNMFPDIPDTLVIRAEQLARSDRHQEALDRLLQLPERGLPMFAVGLSLAIDRLGMYHDFGRSESQQPSPTFDPASLVQARRLLERLRSFGAFAVYSVPYLTYSGSDPSKPSAEVLPDVS